MRVLCFQEWCVPLIKDGTKYSTIRRKANCKPGDVLSLRYWDGKPRRKGSNQVEFARVVCRETQPISILEIGVQFNKTFYVHHDVGVVDSLVKQEGFSSWPGMLSFFESHYGLPFHGEMIEWEPLEEQ